MSKAAAKAAAKMAKSSAANSAAVAKAICKHCIKSVESDELGLECEICENWFHIKCEDVSEEEYDFLEAHKILHWYCNSCNKSVANVIKLFSSLKVKGDGIERLNTICAGEFPDTMATVIDSKINEAVVKIEDKINKSLLSITEQVNKTDTKLETAIEAKLVQSVAEIKKDLEPTWASLVTKEVDSKFEKVSRDVTSVKTVLEDTRKKADEERDRENRSHNVVIYRVPESDVKKERVKADKAFCLELLNSVLEVEAQESDFKFFRLGKREQPNRPLMIQCRERTLKNRIMESLHKLRSAETKSRNISVTHDLTISERQECKNLAEEANKKQTEETGEYLWRVRGAPGQLKLVKLKKNN